MRQFISPSNIAFAVIALSFPLLSVAQTSTIPNCLSYNNVTKNCDDCFAGFTLSANLDQCCPSDQSSVPPTDFSAPFFCMPSNMVKDGCVRYDPVTNACTVCIFTDQLDGKGGCTPLSLQIGTVTFTSFYDLIKDYIANYEKGKNGNQNANATATAELKALTDAVANGNLNLGNLDQLSQNLWFDWCHANGNSDTVKCAGVQ